MAADALAGYVYAPVGLATHYHTTWVNPYWAPSLAHIGTIGAHRFYRWPGAASRPEAFSDVYNGGEPSPAPARAAQASEPAPDPVAVAQQYQVPAEQAGAAMPVADAEPRPGQRQARTPAFRQEMQPAQEGSGSVRPEYANSGQWIARPDQ